MLALVESVCGGTGGFCQYVLTEWWFIYCPVQTREPDKLAVPSSQ